MKTILCSAALLALAAVGCGGSAGPGEPDLGGSPDAGHPDGGSGAPGFSNPPGSVYAVEARMPYGEVNELTALFYGEEPLSFHREVNRIGDCRLLTFTPAQCDVFCTGVCTDTNVCKQFPTRLSAGSLRFTGIKTPVTVTPNFANYYFADPQVKGDLFGAGDAVTVTATGAEFASFSLTGAGVPTLNTAAVVNDEIKLDDSADYRFTWTPSGDPRARMRLTLNANNRGHGAPYEAILECDAADTGTLTVAKELIKPFPDTYRWEICAGRDCPFSSALLYRQVEGEAGKRKVTLTVGSRRAFWVLHRAP